MELNEKRHFNILVVDDNPKNIQVIGNILKESEYTVGFAMDGRQALAQLEKSNDYDLVLLDIEMPELDGYEACKAMREHERLKEIPVIFLTAYTDSTNIIKGFEVGAQDYITKPFNAKELLARVETHLQLKHKSDLIKKMNSVLEAKVAERTVELQKAYNEINKIDTMKTDFLVLISQQIRNPLDAVVGTLNLIKNQDHSSAIKQLFETLNESVSKLEDYTFKALFFSQLSQNKQRVKVNPLNVRELVQFSILELNTKIKAKNIEVKVPVLKGNLFAKADRDLLFKAIVYVLDNAVNFSSEKGLVEINFKEDDTIVTIGISDDGPGFPENLLDNLTQTFHPETEPGNQSSGLSLMIVKLIMDINQGSIHFFNKENGGACVELVLNK